jgi:hypothetical protein
MSPSTCTTSMPGSDAGAAAAARNGCASAGGAAVSTMVARSPRPIGTPSPRRNRPPLPTRRSLHGRERADPGGPGQIAIGYFVIATVAEVYGADDAVTVSVLQLLLPLVV